jgi:hypothetical protein
VKSHGPILPRPGWKHQPEVETLPEAASWRLASRA